MSVLLIFYCFVTLAGAEEYYSGRYCEMDGAHIEDSEAFYSKCYIY